MTYVLFIDQHLTAQKNNFTLIDPQFLVNLSDVDTNDNQSKVDVIIALMQKDPRLKHLDSNEKPNAEYIQFKLFKVSWKINLIFGC